MPIGPWNLWAASGQGVDAECAEVDGQLADDLGGVGVEGDAVIAADARRFRRRVAGRRFRCWRA